MIRQPLPSCPDGILCTAETYWAVLQLAVPAYCFSGKCAPLLAGLFPAVDERSVTAQVVVYEAGLDGQAA